MKKPVHGVTVTGSKTRWSREGVHTLVTTKLKFKTIEVKETDKNQKGII